MKWLVISCGRATWKGNKRVDDDFHWPIYTQCMGLKCEGMSKVQVWKRMSTWHPVSSLFWKRKAVRMSVPSWPLVYRKCGVFHLIFFISLGAVMKHFQCMVGWCIALLGVNVTDAWCVIYKRMPKWVNRFREVWWKPCVNRVGAFSPVNPNFQGQLKWLKNRLKETDWIFQV